MDRLNISSANYTLPPNGSETDDRAVVGLADIVDMLPPRNASEGPIIILASAIFVGKCAPGDIPPHCDGVMLFDEWPIALRDVAYSTEVCAALERTAMPLSGAIAYALKTPVVHERFYVIGRRFRFKVRTRAHFWTSRTKEE